MLTLDANRPIIDEDYFYIAQALWNDADQKLTKKDPNVMAVQITKYTYDEIDNIVENNVKIDCFFLYNLLY